MSKIANVNYSGYKILKILQLLMDKPLSKDELFEFFENDEVIGKKFSEDSLTLYINSLRNSGVKILKPSRYNKTYRLENNFPFLKITQDELNFLSAVKNNLAEKSSWKAIYNFNNLMYKLLFFLDEEMKKSFNKKILHSSVFGLELHPKIIELNEHVENENSLEIVYKSPNSGERKFKISPILINIENDKIYLWCQNLDDMENYYLRIDRILKFKTIKTAKVKSKDYKAIFRLKGQNAVLYKLSPENEKIIDEDQNSVTVEILYKNEFWFIQKILSYGKNCEILEPQELRDEIANRLHQMMEVYNV